MKNNSKQSLATKLILGLSLLAVILMIVTPLQFLDFSKNGVATIWGWTGIFGGIINPYSGKTIEYSFNWVLYVAIIAAAVLAVTTYLIGPKAKGYYIFSALVFVVLAVIFFTTSSTWLESTVNYGGAAGHSGKYLGVGPWFGGISSIVSAICCIYQNRTQR